MWLIRMQFVNMCVFLVTYDEHTHDDTLTIWCKMLDLSVGRCGMKDLDSCNRIISASASAQPLKPTAD